jgi:hypothetical protein
MSCTARIFTTNGQMGRGKGKEYISRSLTKEGDPATALYTSVLRLRQNNSNSQDGGDRYRCLRPNGANGLRRLSLALTALFLLPARHQALATLLL